MFKVKFWSTRMGKSGSAKSAPVLAGVKKSLKKIEPVCQWLHLPASSCDSCVQDTHHIDRDSPDDNHVYLKWTKLNNISKGIVLTGRECYPCSAVRMQYFDDGYTMKTLLKARKTDRVVDDRFYELRHDKVSGAKKFVGSKKVDVTLLIKKSKKDFDEEYVAGTFQPLADFAKQRNLTRMDFHALIEHIEVELKLKVMQNKRDEWGVELMDMNDGSYRFKRGKRDEVEKSKEEIASSKQQESDFESIHFFWKQKIFFF